MPYLNDPHLEALAHRIIRKLQNMTDKEFERLAFTFFDGLLRDGKRDFCKTVPSAVEMLDSMLENKIICQKFSAQERTYYGR